MNIKEIEQRAQEVLAKCGISSVPIPVEDIADKHGVQVSRAPSKEFSGILIRKENRSLMGINSTESSVRQRFTIAHELGHYFLHGNRDVFVEYRDNGERVNKVRGFKETQANIFAASVLMPRDLLEKDFQKIVKNDMLDEHHITFLAEKYDVSEKAMSFRLMNLGLSKA